MRVLGDFFALRPVFTFWGLRLIWYVYLTNTIIQAYIALEQVSQALAQRGVSWLAWSPNPSPSHTWNPRSARIGTAASGSCRYHSFHGAPLEGASKRNFTVISFRVIVR